MKRNLLFLTCLIGILFIGACGNNDATDSNDGDEASIGVDKGLLNVELTIPPFFFEDEDIDTVITKIEADGMKEVTKNDDGSLTYKMSKSAYKDLMTEMEESTLAYVAEIKESGDFTSIDDITHNKSFSEFTIVAEQEPFENSFDAFAVLGLGMTGMTYQIFDGKDADKLQVIIHLEDVDSGEIFNTIIYPDDLQDDVTDGLQIE